MCTEAYYEIVEALKPPDSDPEDEFGKASDKELSRSNQRTPASSEEVVISPDTQKDDEATQDGELAGKAEEARPKKRRRS